MSTPHQTRVVADTPFATHVVSVGTQGPAGPEGPPGPRGPAFEAGDIVGLRFDGTEAALDYANGDTNRFPVSGVIDGGKF